MHDDLGERLLQAGVITQAQLTSLQLAPNTTGGSLIRDVLRLGVPESAVYAFFERRGYGPPAEGPILAARDASLGERIPRSTVTRLLALPLSRVSGAILTAMADPSDRAAVAELAHRLDSPIRPVLARVSDLERLIQEAYGDGTPSLPVRRSITGLPIVEGRVERQETPAFALVHRRVSDPSLPLPPGVATTSSGDSSSAIEPIIPLIRPSGTTAPEIPPPEVPHRPTERGLARPSIPTERGLSIPPVENTPNPREPWPRSIAPTAARSSRPPAEAAPRSSRPPAETERNIKLSTPVPPAATPAPPSSTERDFLSLTGRRPSIPAFSSVAGGPPVPIESSLREIARATDRDAVLRAACHATATVCRSAVFLARRRDLLIGWEGAGVGIARDSIRNLWLPISGPSVFRDALSRARDYVGPPGTSSVDCVYRAVTGSHGGTTLIRPIMLRGKVIALLAVDGLSYGDHGTMRVTTVVNAVVEAFERIILANKAAGRPSEPPIAD